jgi:DDE superfamily endonuclease
MSKEQFWNQGHGNIHHRILKWSGLKSRSMQPRAWRTRRSPPGWTRHSRSCASGENDFLNTDWKALRRATGEAARLAFPPEVVVAIKAFACELPTKLNLPLSRLSMADIQDETIRRGLVASIGKTTLWRWLSEDAIRPWYHRTWIFPRDPQFAKKAGRVLDLYEGLWEGMPLSDADCVLSTDEKTSIQARRRKHPTSPTAPGRPMRIESEYERKGAWAYLAAWDVRRAKVFGRCEESTGIGPFNRLLEHVMAQEPYKSAPRVFCIMDNGSSHRGERSDKRLCDRWKNIVPVHTPVHASWLNQIEVYFSVVQRKALTPNDFDSLAAVEDRLLRFQESYQESARPFQWKFTRRDLVQLLARMDEMQRCREIAA